MASPQRKKQRPIRSCLSCRSRRVKCNQGYPVCSNCKRAGRSCQYNYNGKDRLLSDQTRHDDATTVLAHASSTGEDGQRSEDAGHLHRSLGGRTRYIGPTFWAISNKDEPEFANFLDDRPDEGPDLSCVCDEYTGLHLWEGSRTSAIKTLQNELFRYDSLHSLGQIIETVPSKEICDSLWAAFIATIYPLIPILHLPTFYQQYDDFWACLASYQTKGPPEGLLAECPTFLVLLLSILFCGSLHCYLTQSEPDGQAKSSTEEQKQQSQSLYRATIQALTLLSFPRDPTIYSLAAFVILHVPLIREESERSSTFISTAFRVGQALGLHRDPKHFNATDIEAEIRRRLWWHILHKDTLSSSATGLPQMMWSQKQHDTALISECRDDNLRGVQTFGTPVSGLSNEDSNGILKDSSLRESTQITSLGCVDYSALRDEEVDCRQVVSAGRFLITNTLRDILERHTEPKPWSIQEVYTFERLIERTKIQVQGRMDRLQDPNTLDALNDVILADTDINQHSLPPREASIESWTLVPTSQNRVFLHWARKVLGLMLEKAYCTLYQPLEACSDQAVWQRFRESAVSHFHAYIKDYITMCTEPSYVAFQWVYPGNYQPLQAVAFLLMDTLKNPTSSQALTSRDLIDRVFSMLSHDGGVVAEQNGRLQQRSISRSGQEAWNMLLQLRRRVWRNMGVDPSVLWTCAHQHDDAHDDPNSSKDSYSEEKSSTEGAPRSVEDPQMPRSSNMYDSQQQPTIDSFSMDLHELEPGDQSHNFGSFDWIM